LKQVQPKAGDDRNGQQARIGLDGRLEHIASTQDQGGHGCPVRKGHAHGEGRKKDEDQTGHFSNPLQPQHLIAREAQRVHEKVHAGAA